MTQWDVHKYNRTDINSGVQFTEEDGVAAGDINAVVGNSFYAAENTEANVNLVNNIYAEVSSTPTQDGNPTVEVQNAIVNSIPTKKFVFASIHGKDALQMEGTISTGQNENPPQILTNYTAPVSGFNRQPYVSDTFLGYHTNGVGATKTYISFCIITAVSSTTVTYQVLTYSPTAGIQGQDGAAAIVNNSTSNQLNFALSTDGNNNITGLTITVYPT